ncbi:MAG: DUF2807 domain-containing protein [Muribaculaceae bacterium]|nr:DUF2807 domain-containing protein [Muribaculaceae bacterium]
MKKNIFVIAGVLLLGLMGCSMGLGKVVYNGDSDNVQTMPANAITKNIPVNGNITRLSSYTVVDIKVIEGGTPSITIKGSASDLEKIRVTASNGLIDVRGIKGHISRKVELTVKGIALSKINLYGSGNLTADKLNGHNINCNLVGAGDIKIGQLSSQGAEFILSGAGDISIDNVAANSFYISLSGAGDVNVGKVSTNTFNAVISGVGDINVDKIDAVTVTGSLPGAGDMTLDKIKCTTCKGSVAGVGTLKISGECNTGTFSVSGTGTLDASQMKGMSISKSVSGVGKIK